MLIAGVDEAGRGPLAGSVIAAVVILDPAKPILGLNDSKQLTALQRESLFIQITQHALAYAIGEASCTEIDELNILQATLLAMQRALAGLTMIPDEILIDGNRCPVCTLAPMRAIIGGDALIPAISAASILAKVTRDQQLVVLDTLYPNYGFAQHKGYPTKQHRAAIALHGVLPVHRRTFAPIKNRLSG